MKTDTSAERPVLKESQGALRFHWRLPHGGETAGGTRAKQFSTLDVGLPDVEAQTRFCECAEDSGIDSLLTDFGSGKPDPMLLAAALGMATKKIGFIVAYRSGLFSPTMFVQQLNTLSALIDGRFSLNIVAGYLPQEQRSYGDFLSHDERYARTEEFLAVCRAFWRRDGEVNFSGNYYEIEASSLKTPFVSPNRTFPEIFIGGNSVQAQRLALRQGTCWMRLADSPERIREAVAAIRGQGIEVGLRLSIIARPTREEALGAAYSLIEGLDANEKDREKEREFVKNTDSVSIKATYELSETEWLTPWLWTGAVRYYGAPSIALVGGPEDIASAFMEYKRAGVSQFILSGWPKLEEMVYFGKAVLPVIREKEREVARAA